MIANNKSAQKMKKVSFQTKTVQNSIGVGGEKEKQSQIAIKTKRKKKCH